MFSKLTTFLAALVLGSSIAWGQTATTAPVPAAKPSIDLRVITRQVAPFVMKDNDKYSGFRLICGMRLPKKLICIFILLKSKTSKKFYRA